MACAPENFFDVYCYFVNELAGSVVLAAIVLSVILVIIGVKYKMTYESMLLLITLWMLGLFSEATGLLIIYVFILFGSVVMFFYALYKKLSG